jgi:hypothetical protein
MSCYVRRDPNDGNANLDANHVSHGKRKPDYIAHTCSVCCAVCKPHDGAEHLTNSAPYRSTVCNTNCGTVCRTYCISYCVAKCDSNSSTVCYPNRLSHRRTHGSTHGSTICGAIRFTNIQTH